MGVIHADREKDGQGKTAIGQKGEKIERTRKHGLTISVVEVRPII